MPAGSSPRSLSIKTLPISDANEQVEWTINGLTADIALTIHAFRVSEKREREREKKKSNSPLEQRLFNDLHL